MVVLQGSGGRVAAAKWKEFDIEEVSSRLRFMRVGVVRIGF